MTGRLVAVVGPSGVGKDSLIAGLAAARPGLEPVRRTITRPAALGGEPFEGIGEAEFDARRAAGAFCLHWRAHGLAYGIPTAALGAVEAGAERLVNLSRGVLAEADRVFPALLVIHLTASPEVLAARLAGRGRETAGDIAARLARTAAPLPAGLDIHEVCNDGALDETVAAALAALQPVSA
ncbi:MAG: phosphonate metabolism protein/1,5-bisphosphokinase (PRPP-forming) PhnN [Paracoccaceae bacterium]|nr:phosphonate metabolism protein/1,5-bisphosphokinase (PRPP-forming) PhnN [Paracoccaceae bacterium]